MITYEIPGRGIKKRVLGKFNIFRMRTKLYYIIGYNFTVVGNNIIINSFLLI